MARWKYVEYAGFIANAIIIIIIIVSFSSKR